MHPEKLRYHGKQIVEELQNLGHVAVFAGGCVRDGLLNIQPHDYDIATSATPEQVLHGINHVRPEWKTLEIGKSFGVVAIVVDGQHYEVATFRVDGPYVDGRRPESVVLVRDLELDASRRDFTINSLFEDPIQGKIYDFHNGAHHLKNRVLKFVGKASKRIAEDHLRILRAIRFANRYQLRYVPKDLRAIKTCAPLLERVSSERISQELRAILNSTSASTALEDLRRFGILHYVIPELVALYNRDPEKDLWNHALNMVAQLNGSGFPTMFAALIHDAHNYILDDEYAESDNFATEMNNRIISINLTGTICKRLKLSNDDIDQVLKLIRWHEDLYCYSKMPNSIKRVLLADPNIHELAFFHDIDAMTSNPPRRSEEAKIMMDLVADKFKASHLKASAPPLVTGQMLKDLEQKPGTWFSLFLTYARTKQWEGEFDPETAKDWVMETLEKDFWKNWRFED